MKKLVLLLLPLGLCAQPTAEKFRAIYDAALTQSRCYEWLEHLSNNIGPRLSGSEGAEKAVQYSKRQMEQSGMFDKVWLQPVMVPKWVRGAKETAYYKSGGKKIQVPLCALGQSVATPAQGITAEVVEVHSLAECANWARKNSRGKSCFSTGLWIRATLIPSLRTAAAWTSAGAGRWKPEK